MRRALVAWACVGLLTAAQAGPSAAELGLRLAALDPADLDAIERSTGHRVGVRVAEVAEDSPAARLGLKVDDIILTIGTRGVDTPRSAEQALTEQAPPLEILLARRAGDDWEAVKLTIEAGAPAAPAAPGWELRALDPADLDAIERQSGHRVGVMVVAVAPGSPAERAGLRAGDVLLTVAGRGVDSPAAVASALRGVREAEFLAMRAEGETITPVQGTLIVTAAEPVGDDPVNAYFDLLDFARGEAWGRPSRTSPEERRAAAAMLAEALPELDPETRRAVDSIADTWAAVRERWAGLDEQEREAQRAAWRRRLLTPSQILPPNGTQQTFRAEDDQAAFEYPADWQVFAVETDEASLWFVAPRGTEATWEQVVDPAASPPGVLFVLAEADEELRRAPTLLQAARVLAQQYVLTGGAALDEVDALELDHGAVITLVGRQPGAAGERFFWVGAARFGEGQVLAARFGGPVDQAEALLPVYCHLLQTLELNPRQAGGGGSLAVELAAAMIGNAVVATSW